MHLIALTTNFPETIARFAGAACCDGACQEQITKAREPASIASPGTPTTISKSEFKEIA